MTALPPIKTVCSIHGEVQADYNPPCWWWECPGFQECGHAVTHEQAYEVSQ